MNYTLPINKVDFYIKGTFTDSMGNDVSFEIPAAFNVDGTCNETLSIELMNSSIDRMNKKNNNIVPNKQIKNTKELTWQYHHQEQSLRSTA